MKIDKFVLAEAIWKWGEDSQIEMIQEECMELDLALKKLKRAQRHGNSKEIEKRRRDVIGELADVNIVIAQGNILFPKEEIQKAIDYKMNRLQERINTSKF